MYKRVIMIEIIILCFSVGILIAGIYINSLKENKVSEENITNNEDEYSEEEKQMIEYNKRIEVDWINLESLFDPTVKREDGIYLFFGDEILKLEKMPNDFSFDDFIDGDIAKETLKNSWPIIKNKEIELKKDKSIKALIFYIENNNIKQLSINDIIFIRENGTNGLYFSPYTVTLNDSKISNIYRYKIESGNLGKELIILKIPINGIIQYYVIKFVTS